MNRKPMMANEVSDQAVAFIGEKLPSTSGAPWRAAPGRVAPVTDLVMKRSAGTFALQQTYLVDIRKNKTQMASEAKRSLIAGVAANPAAARSDLGSSRGTDKPAKTHKTHKTQKTHSFFFKTKAAALEPKEISAATGPRPERVASFERSPAQAEASRERLDSRWAVSREREALLVS